MKRPAKIMGHDQNWEWFPARPENKSGRQNLLNQARTSFDSTLRGLAVTTVHAFQHPARNRRMSFPLLCKGAYFEHLNLGCHLGCIRHSDGSSICGEEDIVRSFQVQKFISANAQHLDETRQTCYINVEGMVGFNGSKSEFYFICFWYLENQCSCDVFVTCGNTFIVIQSSQVLL